MPISRYHIQSAHTLADPELHLSANKDDSEALLESFAMSGLVGFLRQLGDLAQFAAEMFHDLHEEVMATAARGHRLMSRVQQLEAEVPAIEKAFLSQTHQLSFFADGGIDWHPNLQTEQNLVTCGDLPRFIMDSYEECRGPPRLFLLDKFDVAGAGACLKRYTDPSFFKAESASPRTTMVEDHREKRTRRVKQKRGARPRNGETPEVVPSHSKLHQLFLEERIENACNDPARLAKLKKKQLNGSAVEAKTGKSYMEKILEFPSTDHKMVCENSVIPLPLKLMSDDTSENGMKILEISSISHMEGSLGNENTHSSPNEQELELNRCSENDRETDGNLVKMDRQISVWWTDEMSSNNLKVPTETELVVNEQKKRECSFDGYHSDGVTSEVDDYMDALATIDSEFESDNECRPKNLNIQKVTDSNGKGEHQIQPHFSDSQSFGDSLTSEEISSFEQDRNGEHYEVQAHFSDSLSTGTSCASDDNSLFRRDRNEEHAQLQAQFFDSQSTGKSISGIEDMTSNQHPQTVELQKTNCEFGATSPTSLTTETQSDDTTSGPVELDLRFEDDEDRKFIVESVAAMPDALSQTKDDACPMDLGNNFSNNLDICDTYVHYNPLLQVCNDFNLVGEGECGNHSEIKVLQAESLNEYSSEILVDGGCGSQGEDPISPSLEVYLNSDTKLLLDGRESKSRDDAIATQLNSEDLFPVAGTASENSFTELLCSDFIHGIPQAEPDLAKVDALFPDQQSNFEEIPKISRSTCSLDPVENDGHTRYPYSPECNRQGNHFMVNDMLTVKVQSENQAISTLPSVDSAENVASSVNCLAPGSISSPLSNHSNLHKAFLGSSYSHQMELETSEVELAKISLELSSENREKQLEPSSDIISSPASSLTKLEKSLLTFQDPREKVLGVNEAVAREPLTELAAHKVLDQPDIASTDVQLNLNSSLSSDPTDSGLCNNVQHSSLKEKVQYSYPINDMKMVPLCSELDTQSSESIFVCQNDLQKSKDSSSLPFYDKVEPETHLDLFLKSQVCQQDIGFLSRNEGNHTSEKFQPRQMQISTLLEQERISHAASEFAAEIHPDEPSCDSLSSAGLEINLRKNVMDPSKPLLPGLFPKATKTSLEEMPPMPPLPPMQWRTSKFQQASLVPQSEEIDVGQASFQSMGPITHGDESQFGLSTSEREILLYRDEFLPCMALESNKHKASSGFSVGVSDLPVAFPFQFPVMVSEGNDQYNYPVLERSQIQNPFLTLQNRPPHGYLVASEREMVVNSSPCLPSAILPAECAVSGANPIVQQEKLTQPPSHLMEDTSFEVEKDKPGELHLVLPSECPASGDDPLSPQEKLTQSPSQMLQDAGLEVEKDKPGELHLVLPAECPVSGNDPISPQEKPTQSPSQIMEDTGLEVEKERPGQLHLVLPAEYPVSGDDSISPKGKPTQSPSKIMEEVSSEVKTLEQTSISLEREQEDPSTSPMSPPTPSMEIEQPNHSLLPSEAGMAFSLDKSARTSELNTEMSNGKPKNKLPQHHIPSVNAVAALDRSRLRKVTERVWPQMTPKEDERNSFLEQIRTKSFNLKPAVVTRPRIQGPRTNLRVAAILEKANSIRQALAGSDDDDDADSWSDS